MDHGRQAGDALDAVAVSADGLERQSAVAVGVAIGVALGLALKNILLGVAFGVLIGAGLATTPE